MSRRRTTKRVEPKLGSVTYHILDQAGSELRPPQASRGVAVVKAQEVAMRNGADGDEATLYVERRTLFGQPVEIYRVVRDEDGIVRTFTSSRED